MKVKGTAVKTLSAYIKTKYPDNYYDWLELLSDEARTIVSNPILATHWYDLETAILEPTQHAAKLFFDNDFIKASYQLGKYSSAVALKGIYKIFIKVSSPNFIISRAVNMMDTYYKPGKIEVEKFPEKKVKLIFSEFTKGSEMVFYRIAGWAVNTFEAINCKNVKSDVKINEKDRELTASITIYWE